ncbi:MAG: phage tail protein [Bacillota bacterium]
MSDFGLKIGIDGEKEFKNALRDINQSFKVLGSEMNLVASEFDKNDRSMQALTARNKVLNKEIDMQKEKVETLEKALNNASTSFGENDKRTQAWQMQLNNAKAALNGMEKELKQNDSALSGVADEFNDAEQQSEQFNSALKRSENTADNAHNKFSKLGSSLGKIGAGLGVGVAAIGVAAVGVIAGLGKMSLAAIENADEIQKTADVYGMSAEKIQELTYVGTKLDVELDTITKAQSKLTKSMYAAKDPTKAGADAFNELGIKVTDGSGKLRDSQVVMAEAFTALGKMGNETERNALAMKLFGKSAMELNPLIKAGGTEISKLTEEARKSGAVISDEAVGALDQFGDSFEALKLSVKGIGNELTVGLLPVLNGIVSFAKSILPEISGAIKSGDFTKLGNVLASGISTGLSQAMAMMNKLIPMILNIVGAIGKVILKNLPMMIDSAVSIVMTLIKGIIKALPQLTKGALRLVLTLLDGILDNLPALVKGAIKMVVTLANGIGNALPRLVPKIVDALILIVETIINNMDMILGAALKIIMGLAKGLIKALPRLINALPKIIEGIINFITDNLPEIIEMGIKLVVELAVGLVKAIPQLVSKLPQIIGAIVSGLGKAILAVTKIGSDIVSGIWQGIQDMAQWITDKITDFFSGIIDGVKGLLGIKSPSTVFADIGSNMGEGLGVGFQKSMETVKQNMKKAIPTNFDILTSLNGVMPANSFAGAYAASSTYNLYQTNNNVISDKVSANAFSSSLTTGTMRFLKGAF